MCAHRSGRDPETGVSRTRRFCTDGSGASAVEFAIVAPLFLLVLVGIVLYGIYFGTLLTLSQITAEAARATVAGLDDTERGTLATSRVAALVQTYTLVDPKKLKIVTSRNPSDRNLFDVQLTYDASSMPIFAFAGLVPAPSATIDLKSSIQTGGF